MTDLGPAVAVLRGGGLVLHPTEAVWGLACDPGQVAAVAALYALKQRPAGKGVILAADSHARLAPWLGTVPEPRLQAALASWPGPYTWIFPASAACPAWLTGSDGTVAVRVSAHPVLSGLAAGLGAPVVTSSANLSDAPAPRTLAEVAAPIRAGVAAIVEGDTGGLAQVTSIRHVLTGEVVRG